MHRLSKSIRTRNAKASLKLARSVARELGISRLTKMSDADINVQPADPADDYVSEQVQLNVFSNESLVPC